MVFVRDDVGTLGSATQQWDPVLTYYARAVGEMRRRNPDMPTGWDYQGAMHGRAGPVPAGAVWNQCQHANWFFLPWHRMYLYHFEQIVRSVVIDLGGPADWALPYWDYRARPGAAALPWVFRQPTLPDGDPNPLYTTERNAIRNTGTPLPDAVIDASVAMGETVFSRSAWGATTGFGGPDATPGTFSVFGALESSPHNGVHVQIGGWMSDPDTAAGDPIFWLHHANIDRLWETWNRHGGLDTTDPSWRSSSFPFFGPDAKPVTMRVDAVLDLTGLDYTYTGLPTATRSPVPSGAPAGPGRPGITARGATVGDRPELVGSSPGPISLTGRRTATNVALSVPRAPSRTGLAAAPERGRFYLNVDNIRGQVAPNTSYAVLVNAQDAPDDTRSDHTAGVVSFFGVKQATNRDSDRGTHGLRYTFDITDLVARLRAAGRWDATQLHVTFDPLEDVDETPEIEVGTVSVFYE
jgi:Common central domain of tyrosinase./Polyphenol oxidase middle domain.